MLMCMFRIPLGRARVICLVVSFPAKQLFLNDAFLYLTALSEPCAHSECDRDQETLLIVHNVLTVLDVSMVLNVSLQSTNATT